MEKDYIPKTLEEAFEYLKKFSDKDSLEKWKDISEDKCMFVHHGPGTDIRNRWGLWGVDEDKTNIFKWFNTIGIAMGDDLSTIIYISFHRHLNGKDIDLPNQCKVYWKHWREYDSPYLPPNIEGCSEEYLGIYEKAINDGEI